MLHFIKENRSVIVKMFVNQVGMIFFGFVLSMATNQNDSLFLAASIFSVLFYMFLEYTVAWDLGAHDKIKLDGGRIDYMPCKGIFTSLCANILNLLSGVLTVIGYFCLSAADRVPHMAVSAEHSAKWAVNLFAVPNIICNIPVSLIRILIPAVSGHLDNSSQCSRASSITFRPITR